MVGAILGTGESIVMNFNDHNEESVSFNILRIILCLN